MRTAVAAALPSSPDDPIAALLHVATDTDSSLTDRNRAIWALGQLGDARATGALQAMLDGQECDHAGRPCQYGLRKAIRLCQGEVNIGAIIWRHGDLDLR